MPRRVALAALQCGRCAHCSSSGPCSCGGASAPSSVRRSSSPSMTSFSRSFAASASSCERLCSEQRHRALEGALEQVRHFLIDDLLRALGIAAVTAAAGAVQKRCSAEADEVRQATAGPSPFDMPNCDTMRRARSVARSRSSGRARRDLVEHQLLRRAPAHQHGDLVEQLGPRHEVAILRQLHGVAERAKAARDHRHFVDAIGGRQDLGEQRVTRLA